MTSQILTIRQILEGVHAKNLEATILFVDFSKAFDSIHREKMEQILHATTYYRNHHSHNDGGAHGVVVIAVGNEHGDTSSNPGRY